jgi:hypothetical protein
VLAFAHTARPPCLRHPCVSGPHRHIVPGHRTQKSVNMSVGKEERCYKGRRRVLTPRKSLIVTAALSIKACASSVLACSSCASQSLSCRRYEAGFFRPRNFVRTARAVCRDRIQRFETAFWKRRFSTVPGRTGAAAGEGKERSRQFTTPVTGSPTRHPYDFARGRQSARGGSLDDRCLRQACGQTC